MWSQFNLELVYFFVCLWQNVKVNTQICISSVLKDTAKNRTKII